MKNIKLESDSEKHQIERLEDYFGALAPQIQCDPVKNKPKKMLIRLDTNYQGIDFNNLVFVATVYANVTNPNFNINIHHYSCPVRGDIAIKVYEIKNASYDLNKIKNEVDILETLPGQFALLNGPAQTSCFIKFYGSFWEQGKVYIGMEYIKDTLMAKISEMRTSNISFSEDHMIFYARQLISTHAFMAQLGVYHQDIKPQNILVTANWELRIIDFSVSASKSYDEATLSQTSMHYIQGTQGYMAPELQAHALSGSKSQLKFRPGKADVFSLGLVLLQMYTLKELHTLNMPENHPKLMQLVDNLPFPWFQTLLKSMLQLDYHNRASFKKALNFVPGRATTV